MNATIWGERRFFVPGIVFLAVLAIYLGLSGVFTEASGDNQELGIAALAAVVAGGLAGYPLGLLLYVPFAFVWRFAIGDYNRFIDYGHLCGRFLARTVNSSDDRLIRRMRSLARIGSSNKSVARHFMGMLSETFIPAKIDAHPRGRWETVHTSGGMFVAIVLAVTLSPFVTLGVPHQAAWWCNGGYLVATVIVVPLVLLLLAAHAWMIGHEAGRMEYRWFDLCLEEIEGNPAMLKRIVLREFPGKTP